MLGYRRHRSTAGYAHFADAHLVEAVEIVGRAITSAIAGTVLDSLGDLPSLCGTVLTPSNAREGQQRFDTKPRRLIHS